MDYDVKDMALADKGLGRIESTGGSFPAACLEFGIPADPGSGSGAGAGIQQGPTGFPRIQYGAGPISSTGQTCQARNDGPQRLLLTRCLSAL